MSKRSTFILATLAGSLCLGLAQARADFCLNASINTGSLFFHFSGKYPSKPDKITKLNGKVLFLEGSMVTDQGPAYGQILGLPEGDAGNSLGVSFAVSGEVVGQASIVLDDNNKMSGAGRVTETSSTGTTSFPIGAEIVDCADRAESRRDVTQRPRTRAHSSKQLVERRSCSGVSVCPEVMMVLVAQRVPGGASTAAATVQSDRLKTHKWKEVIACPWPSYVQPPDTPTPLAEVIA